MKPYPFWLFLGRPKSLQNSPTTGWGFLMRGGKLEMSSKLYFGLVYHIYETLLLFYFLWGALRDFSLQNPPTTTQGFLIRGGYLDTLSKLPFGQMYHI